MELTTARLTLREFQPDDWRAVLEYQHDPRYLRFYPWTDRSADDVRRFVDAFCAQQRGSPRARYQLAVTERETGVLVGNCGVRVESVDARQGSIGYELDPRYWGRGYATEAAAAMMRIGFCELGLHRLWARVLAANEPSIRVLERLRMRPEGRLREHERFKGRWWDVCLYGVLRNEWLADRPIPCIRRLDQVVNEPADDIG